MDTRQIRVFVSSTFCDMQHERDVLVKRVFPQLRKLCTERAVAWTEVDLRWGITDEESAEGQVLPVCLEEIRLCRPYFIGILGERYGWVPDSIDPALAEREPWLREHGRHSVTELEILHGVLNTASMQARAYFYFRDPAYISTLPADEQAAYREGPASDAPDSPASKLARLKDRIRRAHADGVLAVPPREHYADPAALGDLVLADFTALIDRQFPAGAVPDAVDRERQAHDEYGRTRALAHVRRPRYVRRLDEFVGEGSTAPLIVLGESGSGKSALLADWAIRHREAHPDAFIIQRFIGSTSDSADWVHLLRPVMIEITRRFDLPAVIPDQPDAVRAAFAELLVQVAGRGRIVLILDGLNQLDDRDSAPDLGWLPPVMPPNVRLMLSTIEGRPLDAIRRRGWLNDEHTVVVEAFEPSERRDAILAFLGLFRKRLSEALMARLIAAPQTGNPLFLRTLLDELRQTGRHDQLDACLTGYLGASDPTELFARILGRWDRDYGAGRDLVRRTCGLIGASQRGLSEAELATLLGADGQPLPRALWTPLFLAAEHALANRSGLLTFGHAYLRDAVSARWLSTAEELGSYRRELAAFFEAVPGPAERRLDELPWLLLQLEDWDRLRTELTHAAVFYQMRQDHRRWELHRHWLALARYCDPVAAYQDALERWRRDGRDRPRSVAGLLVELAGFHRDRAEFQAGEPLLREALDVLGGLLGPDHRDVLATRSRLAMFLVASGDRAAAEPLLRQCLADYGRTCGDDDEDTLGAESDLAALLLDVGRYEEAEQLSRDVLERSEHHAPPASRTAGAARNQLTLALGKMGRYAEALPMLRAQVAERERTLGRDHPDTLASVHNLAWTLVHAGLYGEALPLYDWVIAGQEVAFGPDHPETLKSVNNAGFLASRMHDHAGAERLFRRALDARIRALGPDHPDTLESLTNLAHTLVQLGRAREAEPLLTRALDAMVRTLGPDHPDAIATACHLAYLWEHTGRHAEAETLYRQAVAAYERVLGPTHHFTLTVVANLARVLARMDRLGEAAAAYERAVEGHRQSLGPAHPELLDEEASLRAVRLRLAGAERPGDP